MHTDSIFYQLFRAAPGILFELLGESFELGNSYVFRSQELKQTAFRIDGVFVPKPDSPNQTVIFAEVQFQKDPFLYDRMFSEIGIFLSQNPEVKDWRAVAIFPRRSLEPQDQYRHRNFLQGDQFQVIYLEDLKGIPSNLLGVQLMQLIICKPNETRQYAQKIVTRLREKPDFQNQAIIELVSTVMVYKFPQLSREEIEAMFSVSELKQTRVYQEAREEGRTAEAQSLVASQLQHRFGELSASTQTQIQTLSLEQIEELGKALLDFSSLSDLDLWLRENQ